MTPISFQILSDLHLETHASYKSFKFAQTASCLALLGDIGHVANDELFSF
jgi:predicted phosphodiesterase